MAQRQFSSRGFTLLEAMVAVACSAIVGVAALMAYSGLIRSTTRLRQQAALAAEGRMVVEFVLNVARGAGGGSLPPGLAVDWELGPNAPTVMSVLIPRPTSPLFVTTVGGSTVDVSGCTNEMDIAIEDPPTPFYAVLLQSDEGMLVRLQRTLVIPPFGGPAPPVETSSCSFDLVAQVADTGIINFSPLAASLVDMGGASLIPVRYRTLRVVPGSGGRDVLEATWNGSPPPLGLPQIPSQPPPSPLPDPMIVSTNIVALELSFGYDFSPPNGEAFQDVVAPTFDEWLYNDPSEFATPAFVTPTQGFATGTGRNVRDLRAVSIAAAIGASSRDQRPLTIVMPSTHTVDATGKVVYISHGTAALRTGE